MGMNQPSRSEFDFAPLQNEVDLVSKRMQSLVRQLKDAIQNEHVGSATAEEDYKELQYIMNEYKRISDSVRLASKEPAVTLVEYQNTLVAYQKKQQS
jgi:hypothetical protein